MRTLTVVPAPLAAARPSPVDGTGTNNPFYVGEVPVNPLPAGSFAVSEQWNVQTSTDAGVSPGIRVLPVRSASSGTYTLTIYGWMLVGTRWHSVLLWSGSCVCNITETDTGYTTASKSIPSGDQLCSAITPNTAITSSQYAAIANGSDPATLLVRTNGCPFITFASADAAAYVAVSPQT